MNNNSNKRKNIQKNVHRQSCDCACVLCTDEGLMYYLQCSILGCVMCCSGGIWPGEKTVLVSGCFGAQCSVAPARGQPFKERYVALKPLYTFQHL